jgi:PAS domain S-box-containing protein
MASSVGRPEGAAEPVHRTTRVLQTLPAVAAWLAIVTGAVVLAGWALDVPLLKTILPASVPMKANTALAFILAGTALMLAGRPTGRAAGAGVLLLGAATLSEYVVGWDLRLDELLFRDPETPFRGPGRMALATAIAFVALGTALLAGTSSDARRRRGAEVLSGVVALLAVFTIERYAVGITPITSSPMALPTALLLAALSLGVIASVPDSWVVARLASPGPDGILTRRLLPAAVVLPPVVAWLMGLVEQAGWLDAEHDMPLEVVITITLLLAAGTWSVSVVQRVERDRRRAEAALERSERYHRALIEQALDIITIIDADAVMRFVSPSVERILGYAPAELVGQRAFDFVHPDDLEATLRVFTEGIATSGAVRTLEYRFRHKDGSWRYLEGVGRNLLDDPVVKAAVVNARDITERKAADEALRAARQRLERLLASSNAVLYSVRIDDSAPAPEWVSDNVERVTGHTAADALQPTWWLENVHPDDRASARAGVATLLATGQLSSEYRFHHRGGEYRWVRDELRLIPDEGGTKRAVGVWVDITDRKTAEENQQTLLRELQAALAEVKSLRGLIRICANCKRVLTDEGSWEQFESYVRGHSDVEFSHGICPDCAKAWSASASEGPG